MEKKLSVRQIMVVASMLFGLLFGAGNLIFPVSMGQLAGAHMWQAVAGFVVTGVGVPILGVAALGISQENSVLELSGRVGRRYGIFFTCALHLTVGPFFAIPRCATVSFTIGVAPVLSEGNHALALCLFSLAFFAVVLFLALRPGEILTWVGKVLTPLFLVCLGILVLRALTAPMGEISSIQPDQNYTAYPFFQGFLEGYNTMDALAGLAFGIIVINAIRGLGVARPGEIAKSTVKAGIFTALLMTVIYVLMTAVGAQSRGVFQAAANGGDAFVLIADYYFGTAGILILAATGTLACLKTAVGLVTSCSAIFVKIFPAGPSYRTWTLVFTIASFAIANTGLNTIIAYSLPVLMFLYPLAVTLILLTLCGRFFGNDRVVYQWVTGCTAVAAGVDFLYTLPKEAADLLRVTGLTEAVREFLPLAELGFGWLCPAVLGLGIGMALHWRRKER
ncbi:MAG TPA: branched-chain amino acid transport system II carrier protein [Candidatus Dorea gallistercoris]|uniref:Branched-chain amino acid transport system carrier protein n=1 Tax=Candidatus Dorea gallistercoris TaxID=2838542 RepID=A0A9D1R7J3_9FIRM|nr:branched-chain amino acid transport system II carrier protein [Candidatus Dorea gallistercoris]